MPPGGKIKGVLIHKGEHFVGFGIDHPRHELRRAPGAIRLPLAVVKIVPAPAIGVIGREVEALPIFRKRRTAVIDAFLHKGQGLWYAPAVAAYFGSHNLAVVCIPLATAETTGKVDFSIVAVEDGRPFVIFRIERAGEVRNGIGLQVDHEKVGKGIAGPVVGVITSAVCAVGSDHELVALVKYRSIFRPAGVKAHNFHLILRAQVLPALSDLTGADFPAVFIGAADFYAQVFEGPGGFIVALGLFQRKGVLAQGFPPVLIIIGNLVPADGEVALIEVFVSFADFKSDAPFLNAAFGFLVFFLKEFEGYSVLLDLNRSLPVSDFFSVSTAAECRKKKHN